MISKMYKWSGWLKIKTTEQALLEDLEEIIEAVDFTILAGSDHSFEPQGLTVLWLLAESHLALHTYPENGNAYLELTICNKEKYELFVKTVESEFEITSIEQSETEAGQ